MDEPIDRECVDITLDIEMDMRKKLVASYVKQELSPCARENFDRHLPEGLETALLKAVINEMVLRILAEAIPPHGA